jgi:phosphoenolpyruvate-protein phosphotransferase
VTGLEPSLKLVGLGVSPGLAAGNAWVFNHDPWKGRRGNVDDAPRERLTVRQQHAQIEHAVEEAQADLQATARRTETELDAATADIFRAQAAILSDPLLLEEIQKGLAEGRHDAEAVVQRVFKRWEHKFRTMDAELLRDRADDIADLRRRLLWILAGAGTRAHAHALQNVPPGSVLVAARLLPSDTVCLSRRSVVAVVVEWGGRLSHAAILTRQLGIPAVSRIDEAIHRIRPADRVLVDGTRGTVVVRPDEMTDGRFTRRIERHRARSADACRRCREPARTLDGLLVRVEANICSLEDACAAAANGADGIGLYRIEGLYLSRRRPPSEDELLVCLRDALEPLKDKPVTVRLLDAGGDKPLAFARFAPEPDPALGRRGVRLLLEYPELLNTQLRALLRLARDHTVRILIPMVTLAEEMLEVKRILREAARDISAEGLPPLGAMIETPAAALSADQIAQHADFLSVGTNDLTQYTMAAGRENTLVSRYFVDDHPAVLKLLELVADAAGDLPLSLCGELAGRKRAVPRLVELGFGALSVPPSAIPEVKAEIRRIRLPQHQHPQAVPVE